MAFKKYTWILLDLDDTLFDYAQTEYHSLKLLCEEFFGKFNDDLHKSYSAINRGYWNDFQNGKINIDDVKTGRFKDFSAVNFPTVKIDPKKLSERFVDFLSESIFMLDGAKDFLDFLLQHNFKISAITNGIQRNQLSRVKLSGLDKYFEALIISEEVGHAKPKVEYFDFAKKKIGFVNEATLIVGDNIESDIRGGHNYGIDTCWFNLQQKENLSDINPTYEVKSYDELKALLTGEITK